MPNWTRQRVYELLQRMPQGGLTAAKQLFWTELNYDRMDTPPSRHNWPGRAGDALQNEPVVLAWHESSFGSFDVIYARLASEQVSRDFPLSLTAERLAIAAGRAGKGAADGQMGTGVECVSV